MPKLFCIESGKWPGQLYCVEDGGNGQYQAVVPEAIADESALFTTEEDAKAYLIQLFNDAESK